jgi:hypothetical protein
MALLIFAILSSITAGIVYAVITKDKASGISLNSYVLACPALVLALYGAGEFIGMEKPGSFI